MSIYNVDGNQLNTVYSVDGNVVASVYDVNGNLIDGTVFADDATITTVYTSSRTSQPQGGCADDDNNIYACMANTGTFIKYSLVNHVETAYSFTASAYGHANGMTYNPNTERFYLASQNDTGEVFVFDKSFNLVDTLYAKDASNNVFNCWNIAYDRANGRFITMSGGTIYFFSDAWILIDAATYDPTEWKYTRQDIETDGNYIYAMSYNPNAIFVFDFNGNMIKEISCTAFSGEPESMCYDWTNDKYYIEGKSTYYVIREAVFKE